MTPPVTQAARRAKLESIVKGAISGTDHVSGAVDDILEAFAKAIAEERASVVAYLRMLSDGARAHHREVCQYEDDEILGEIVTRMESHTFSADQIEKGTHDPATAIRATVGEVGNG